MGLERPEVQAYVGQNRSGSGEKRALQITRSRKKTQKTTCWGLDFKGNTHTHTHTHTPLPTKRGNTECLGVWGPNPLTSILILRPSRPRVVGLGPVELRLLGSGE